METDLFAAIAPMRGAMIKRSPVPKVRPEISILLVCGADDPLFKGGNRHGAKCSIPPMNQWEHGPKTTESMAKQGHSLNPEG
jgi:hypothetical protein